MHRHEYFFRNVTKKENGVRGLYSNNRLAWLPDLEKLDEPTLISRFKEVVEANIWSLNDLIEADSVRGMGRHNNIITYQRIDGLDVIKKVRIAPPEDIPAPEPRVCIGR